MSSSVPPGSPVHLPPSRHALGLPAGSIRALLAFGVLGLLWALLLSYVHQKGEGALPKLPLDFIYLQYLMVLILVHFFTAHGRNIGPQVSTGSPLHLPRGSVRFLLLVGVLGLAYYLYQVKPEYETPPQGAEPLLLLLLLSGYFLGHVVTRIVLRMAGGTLPYWFQDIQAWFALIALVILGILMIVHVLINPSLSAEYKLDVPQLEAILAAIVGFYFGARS
jgi:hypothetical protein